MTMDIPNPVLRRLPLYYRRLLAAVDGGEEYVSSEDLGLVADVPSAQVRKDLVFMAEKGRPGVGYNARNLALRLEELLGLGRLNDAVLVGAGNLGRALAVYPGFIRYGLRIVALFDSHPKKIGDVIGALEVLPVERLSTFIEQRRVKIGIVTTTASAAQEVADLLVAGGVKAIWNFAPRRLKVPKGVFVKEVDLGSELAVLLHSLTRSGG